jgi:hypothetical protein
MKRWHIARGLLAFVVVGAIALPVVYEIAITISPNRTIDGHPTMPIGHVFVAIILSPILGAVAAYFAARPSKMKLDQ